MRKIWTCLWFDHQAEEAVNLYRSVFKNSNVRAVARYGKAAAAVSGQKEDSIMNIDLVLEDITLQAINGGPMFKFTPAISFYVTCESEEEINRLWSQLSPGGNVRMGLDKYPWAEKYGWTTDKFGVEWQLIYSSDFSSASKNKIIPSFLFVDELFGKGEEALNFYLSVFPNSKIESKAVDENTNTIMHCRFSLAGQGFVLMEGAGKHGFTFTSATSIVVNCDTQEELDHYWNKLLEGGKAEQCGWLKDKYGVSWQIVPSCLREFANSPHYEDVMAALFKMVKIDIATLKAAARV